MGPTDKPEAIPPAEPLYASDQLRLVHNELDRQRDMNARRHGNMYTRAAILIAASGVLGTVQSATHVTPWQFISVVISLAAACFGLWAMRPTRGMDADARKNFEKMLSSDPYSTEHYIVRQNLEGLRVDIKALDSLRQVVAWGYGLLVAAWLSSLIIAFIHSANLI